MSERLPFPVHGTRPHDGADAALLAEAARLLYTVNLLASTSGVPVQHLTLKTDGGTVTASVHGPLAFKSVHPERTEETEQETSVARLAWVPEGFVITPRTSEAPDGYGMPPTKNGRGTPGGRLTEVIINRYKNNQYPDTLMEHLPKSVPRTAPVTAGLFYMDWELAFSEPLPAGTPKPAADPTNTGAASNFSIGAGTKKLWVAQFRKKGDGLGGEKVSRFDTVFREPEDTKWHCHRPQYGSETESQKQVRESVNALREKVPADPPLLPLSPPLKGTEGSLSLTPLHFVQMTGVLGHSNPNFREGHKTFEMRMMFRDGLPVYGGENLLVLSEFSDPALTRGEQVTKLFSESPRHYENIVHDWHLENQGYAVLQSAIIPVKGIHSKQLPPYEVGSPTEPLPEPVSGYGASQIFMTHQYFAHFGACGREEEQETGSDGKKKPRKKRIGVSHGMSGAAFFSPFLISSGNDPHHRPPAFMTFMGRRVYITKEADKEVVAVLAARHIVTETKEFIRAVVLARPVFVSGQAVEDHNPEFFGPRVEVLDGDAHDFFSTQKTVSTFWFPANTSVMSTVRMSKSGKKAVFCYAEPVPCLKRFRFPEDLYDPEENMDPGVLTDPEVDVHQDGYETPFAHRRYVWGEKLHFMEWVESEGDSNFTEVAVESLDITPKYKYDNSIDEESGTDSSIVTTCKGNYRLFADYNDETLVYAKVHVDSRQDSILTVFYQDTKDKQYTRSLRGKIVFPDNSEFAFSEIDVDYPATVAEEDSVTGFYRQILWMDIMRPEDIVYLHHELRGQHRIAAEGTLYSRGEQVKDVDGSIRKADDTLKNEVDDISLIRQRGERDKLVAMDRPPILPDVSRQGGLSPFAFIYDAHEGKSIITVAPYDTSRYSPPFAYKARLVAAITGDLNVGGRFYTEGFGKKHYYYSDLVGPEILFASPMGEVQAEFYGGEAIVAGKFSTPFLSARKVWEGDKVYFHESSLDLKEITGLDGLKNDILPIGAI